MALAFIVPVSVLAVCAENEVWQPEISYENGQCTEYTQSWSKNNGFTPPLGFGQWGCENFWGGIWFQNQCHLSGHVINTCVAYEQIEVDNGQCVADDEGDEDNGGDGNESDGSGDDGGDTGGDTGENGEAAKTSSGKSGTSLWTRLSNVTGTKYTKENISLEDGRKLYDQIMADKREAWDNRNN